MRHARWVGLLCVACASPAPRAPVAAPSAKPAVVETAAPPAPPPKPVAASDADAVVAEALEQVSRLRQLPPTGPVMGKTIERDAMIARVKAQLRREVPAEVIAAQNELLFGLGVVPKSFDYEKALLELMGAQLAGFYEPGEKTMFLAVDLPPREQDATLAHELVHALQDQHYDLKEKIGYREDGSDQQSALHALAEGDATSAMLDHVLAARGMTAMDLSEELFSLEARGSVEMTPAAAGVPSILKRSIIAPYTDGMAFVGWARRQGGWSRVDEIWRTPPSTTEQLLHVEKYVAREPAEPIVVPSAPRRGPATVVYRDILGEQSVRLLFEEWMPRKQAIEAATSWGGDRIAVFGTGSSFAVAWHLRYDDEPSAVRGIEAFARGVLRPDDARPHEMVGPDKARAAVRSGSVCRNRSAAGPFAVLRKGRDLAVVAGPWERRPDGPRGTSSCAAALAWARSVAQQR